MKHAITTQFAWKFSSNERPVIASNRGKIFTTWRSFAIALLFGSTTILARGPARSVTYSSECSCENDHGVARWRAKTDSSEAPTDLRNVQPIVPSDIFAWEGPGTIPRGGARLGIETRWFALTGRVITVQAENDGDVHLVLGDASGNKPGKVIAEIPLGDRWCRLRTSAFSWTDAVFPLEVAWQEYPFRLIRRPVVTVIGKAFYDTDHSGKNYRNNRRPRAKDKAVWEIHPVMQMEVKASVAAQEPEREVTRPNANVAPTSTPALNGFVQTVTLVRSVKIKIPYGETILPPGMKLPLLSRDGANVIVRYLDGTQSIPAASTDLK